MGGPDTAEADRARALEWADRARRRRFELRQELSGGRVDLAAVLAEGAVDELTGRVRLGWVLESLPGARKVDTRRQLGRLGLGERILLADLDDASRGLLEAEFPLGGPSAAGRGATS